MGSFFRDSLGNLFEYEVISDTEFMDLTESSDDDVIDLSSDRDFDGEFELWDPIGLSNHLALRSMNEHVFRRVLETHEFDF